MAIASVGVGNPAGVGGTVNSASGLAPMGLSEPQVPLTVLAYLPVPNGTKDGGTFDGGDAARFDASATFDASAGGPCVLLLR